MPIIVVYVGVGNNDEPLVKVEVQTTDTVLTVITKAVIVFSYLKS